LKRNLVAVTSVANTISFSYAPVAGSGTLTVSSGGQVVASIDTIGSYTSATPFFGLTPPGWWLTARCGSRRARALLKE
jgi:hypothetical protein